MIAILIIVNHCIFSLILCISEKTLWFGAQSPSVKILTLMRTTQRRNVPAACNSICVTTIWNYDNCQGSNTCKRQIDFEWRMYIQKSI